MYQKFVDNIIEKNLIQDDDKVLACVSGGADSMSMLHMLIKYLKCDTSRLEVAHFDHQLRGEYSKRDADFVKEFCRDNNIVFHLMTMDIKKQSEIEKLSIEECGRKYRYKFFYEIVNNQSDFKIALAHNLDDQAETVLMRIIRGTGIDGLVAIKEKDGRIIRPLLGICRREIEEYIQSEGIEFVQDHTNFENDYTRNKIRNVIIPLIEKNINPSFKSALVTLSSHARDEKMMRDEYINGIFAKLLQRDAKYSIHLDKKEFNSLEEYVQLNLLRFAILRLKGNLQGFDYAHYKEFLNLTRSDQGKEIVINDISASVSYESFIIKNIKSNPLDLACPIQGEGLLNVNGFDIDYDLLSYQAIIRKRKNGDRIFSRGKDRKLKDFFIDNKIDLADRDFYPIVEIDDEIIAVGNVYRNNKAIDRMKIKININGGLDYGHFEFS